MLQGERNQRDVELVEILLHGLHADEPVLRVDLIEAARTRLETGPRPSALDLADTVVAEFA